MSVAYVAVNWNRQKRIYDAVLAVGVAASVGVFAGVTVAVHPTATAETALIRGIGITAFLLLHVILAIGPLARLDRRFLPLLYNRRHLGVTLGLLALAHAGFALFQYHALGNVDPITSVLTSNRDWRSLADFPFEWLGFLALVVLLVMAATSHDYWLSVLTPPVWKGLHMLVYLAYLALVLHVGLGFLQDERHPVYALALGFGVIAVGMLHLAAAGQESPLDDAPDADDWIDAGAVADIPEGRAKIRRVGGERVAVFRHEGRLSCVSNVCKHQNGPLGEGRIIDGCITCPWHGYQYRPHDGTSPPPFNDAVPTFNLRVAGGRVLVNRRPNPAGTAVEPVAAEAPQSVAAEPFYVGYQAATPAALTAFLRPRLVGGLVLVLGLIGTWAAAQSQFGPGTFEYGHERTVEGVLRMDPYPVLELSDSVASRPVARYLLAGMGKHGAGAAVAGLAGHRLRVRGTLAHRGEMELLELAAVTDEGTATAASGAIEDLGEFVLDGEVADSKCYLGVMNPGRGKTHRGCAARCLSGGLIPLFVTRGETGDPLDLVLVETGMNPFRGADRLAGKRLTLRGRVYRRDGLWFLQIPPLAGRR